MAIRPGTNDVYIGDPGGQGVAGWEEINRIPDPTATPIRNFGWPCYEGGMVNGSPSSIKYSTVDSLNLDLCESLYANGTATPNHWAYKHIRARRARRVVHQLEQRDLGAYLRAQLRRQLPGKLLGRFLLRRLRARLHLGAVSGTPAAPRTPRRS